DHTSRSDRRPDQESAAARDSIFDERVHRIETIHPLYLLTVIGPPRLVRDRHLDDTVAGKEQLSGHLRLEIEADGPQADLPEHLTSEHLVTGLHIGELRQIQN